MRRKLALATTVLAGAATVVAVQFALTTAPAAAATQDNYTWKNVQIAGGGYVPGIIFSRAQANLIYARTDIGGAYRWNNSTSTWTPLPGQARTRTTVRSAGPSAASAPPPSTAAPGCA